ncbi:zf-TFIIB domain-containing protein [Rhodoferax lithotrophicus]|nr:zf-TFIIB domain-containing protein [Rhodoferax sp. MIZ03]
MSIPRPCPSCQVPMEKHAFAGVAGPDVLLDLCFACHGIWFDPLENLKLSPAAVVELFRLLHAHRDDARQPLASKLSCPHCKGILAQGFDVVKSGRYITYRCTRKHGRFSVFSSFMIEKGFVRQLTQPEVDDMARRVAVIYCNSCGAPVDLRKDHACPYCRAAFSLLDPQAVERALQGYAKASSQAGALKIPELADALVMVERDRLKAQREAKAQHRSFQLTSSPAEGDLWAAGLELVWKMLD